MLWSRILLEFAQSASRRLDPKEAVSRSRDGDALLNEGRPEGAVAQYQAALAICPDLPDALLGLGEAFLQLGRFSAAAEAYERVLAGGLVTAEILSNLGNALFYSGRLDEAIARYEQALAIKPDLAQTLSNLAEALRRGGCPEEAVARCRQALALNSNQSDTWLNFGNAIQDLGKPADALACYERALSINPHSAGALANSANVLRALGRLAEAEANYRRALAIRPDVAEIHNGLGIVAADLGRFEEAQTHYRAAIGIDPRTPAYYLNLGETKRYQTDDQDLIALEKLANTLETLPLEQQIDLHFALGKAYSDIEDRERSFLHLERGNALKRRSIAYNEAQTQEQFERMQRVFTREFMISQSEQGDPSSLPIFIVGMPRSGSTLVEQILGSHQQVVAGGELLAFEHALAELPVPPGARIEYPELVSILPSSAFRRLGARYIEEVRCQAGRAERMTDKLPGNFLHLGLIKLALPNAHIIHISRDPVDTCLSCFSKLFRRGQEFSYLLPELGRYYKWYTEMMRHWRTVLPAGSVLEVRYEDLVADLEGQARRLLEHCGLAWDPGCLEFHKLDRPVRTASSLQVRQPLYTSSVGRSAPYRRMIQPLLDALDREVGA